MVLLSKVPGMTIFAPSSYQELQQMLRDALDLCTDGPAAIRFPKTAAVHVTDDEVGAGLSAPDMLADAAGHRLVITIEDGLREGGIGSAIADSLRDLAPVNGPAVRVLGVPVAYLPHGKPDDILASLGLDADGVVAEYSAWAAQAHNTPK